MQNSLKIFLSAFIITLSCLISALCTYKIYSSCEQVISGRSPEIIVQKTGRGGTFYVNISGRAYELSAKSQGKSLLSLAVNEIKSHSAELPEPITAVYYAKQIFDEINKN